MNDGRYVVLGLALARSPWFRAVAQWANAASIPVEFVKCMSPIELRAHLASHRPFSALLVDGGLPALDRDLVETAREAGCAVIVVDDVRVTRDWAAIGASAVVNPVFDRKDLLAVLDANTSAVTRADAVAPSFGPTVAPAWRAAVAAVCGAGGTGSSTVAIALAQGLGDDLRYGGMVLLADLARNGEQGMLHDARDVVPGIQEVVDAHRAARPTVEEIRTLTFDVVDRRYQLLLGLRRPSAWATLRPRAFEAAFHTITRGWRAVVCDTDADLEGEDDGGSIDVEERNVMARTCAPRADVVFAVGTPDMKGTHALVRTITTLADHGVPAARVVPVMNRAPKSARSRSEITAAVARLIDGRLATGVATPSPIFLPERRVDEALRDGVRLPGAMVAPLVGAFHAVLERSGARGAVGHGPVPVRPGDLGAWSADAEIA